MKKFIMFFILNMFIYAQNMFLSQNNLFVNSNALQKYYTLKKAEFETDSLLKLTKKILTNKKFKKLSYLEELGKTKVNTTTLLKALLNFLEGQKPYTNTQFDNNLKEAGVLKLIKNIENDTLINLPQKAKKDILNSIKTSSFFNLANKTEKLLKNINKDNIKDVIKNYTLLFNQYVNDLNQIYNPLIQNFTSNIQNKLFKDYRIEAKDSIIKTFEVFRKYLNINKKIYY
jgi:hypothetical protein